jgi:hypothetical protein
MTQTILVVGATGNQGNAVVDPRERERFGALAAERYTWDDDHGGYRLDTATLDDLDRQPRSLHAALVRTGWASVPADGTTTDDDTADSEDDEAAVNE